MALAIMRKVIRDLESDKREYEFSALTPEQQVVELQRAEQRLMQKEDNLDKKEDALFPHALFPHHRTVWRKSVCNFIFFCQSCVQERAPHKPRACFCLLVRICDTGSGRMRQVVTFATKNRPFWRKFLAICDKKIF